MATIKNLKAREILDSKGDPTIEVEVELADGTIAIADVPSGASTGMTEAFELRDNDKTRFFGKGVQKAVNNINTEIKTALLNKDAFDQRKIDQIMIDLDGTELKKRLGGNTIVGVSMAVCRAASISHKISLYQYLSELSGNKEFKLPQPLILIMEGGKHGDWATDIQEFFIIPRRERFTSFAESLRVGSEIFNAAGKILKDKGYTNLVGFEGAYAPREIISNEEAFQIMLSGIEKAGYIAGDEILLGIDGAASEFFVDNQYFLKREAQTLDRQDWLDLQLSWCKKYPIWSLEDTFSQEDWEGWQKLTNTLGKDHQIVGDDLLTTNVNRIQKAIDLKAVNSVLIKLNQIGTVSETIDAIKLSHKAGFTTIISHRGGETNDDFIADLCVGCGSWQCKFGGPDRGERLAKYIRLLRIEEELNSKQGVS